MAEKKVLITPVFRVSFPCVIKPRAQEREDGTKGDPKYGITAVWEPSKFTTQDKERWKAILAMLDETSLAAFKKRWKDLPANFKKGLRDGAEKEGLDGFGPGCMFASLTSNYKPGIVGPDRKTRIVDDPEQFYAGCLARTKVNCYTYNVKGKGVALGLAGGIWKVADGVHIGGGSDPAKDFEDYEVTPEDEKWLAEQGADFGDVEDGGF
jgi:hypothetical protein